MSTLDDLIAFLRLGDHLVAMGSPAEQSASSSAHMGRLTTGGWHLPLPTCKINDGICPFDSFLQLLSVVELEARILQLVPSLIDIPGQHSDCMPL